jgi:hypothetical protein
VQNPPGELPTRRGALRAYLVLIFLFLLSATLFLILALDSSAPGSPVSGPEAAETRLPPMSHTRLLEFANAMIDRALEAIGELRRLLR